MEGGRWRPFWRGGTYIIAGAGISISHTSEWQLAVGEKRGMVHVIPYVSLWVLVWGFIRHMQW